MTEPFGAAVNRAMHGNESLEDVRVERDHLRSELDKSLTRQDELLAKLTEYENREASVCPEDVGCDEYIPHLQAELSALRDELSHANDEQAALMAERDRLAGEVAATISARDALARQCDQLENDREYNAELVRERDAELAAIPADKMDLFYRLKNEERCRAAECDRANRLAVELTAIRAEMAEVGMETLETCADWQDNANVYAPDKAECARRAIALRALAARLRGDANG